MTYEDPEFNVTWDREPTENARAQMDDILEIAYEQWIDGREQQYTVTVIDYGMAESTTQQFHATFYATPEGAEEIAYGWEIRQGEYSKLTDPNYQLSDDDMIQFDIPRNRYRAMSKPRDYAPPGEQGEPHRVDVRPTRRPPRMPREQ